MPASVIVTCVSKFVKSFFINTQKGLLHGTQQTFHGRGPSFIIHYSFLSFQSSVSGATAPRLQPVGVVFDKIPTVAAHILHVELCLPAEKLLCLGAVGVAFRDIAGSAGLDDVGNRHAAARLERGYCLEHAGSLAGAEVDRFGALVSEGVLQGADVTVGKVHDVNVIAHAGAVHGGIIVAENA